MNPHFNDGLGFNLNRAAYVLRLRLKEAFHSEGYDITPEEWTLLTQLWRRDGQRQGELADYTIRDRTTVTRLLDGMVEKGLVRREPDTRDRRIVCTWLTDRGKSLQHKLVPIAGQLLDRGTAQVSDADLRATLKTLQSVRQNLKSDSARVDIRRRSDEEHGARSGCRAEHRGAHDRWPVHGRNNHRRRD